jgi:pilus assembly protein CpaD
MKEIERAMFARALCAEVTSHRRSRNAATLEFAHDVFRKSGIHFFASCAKSLCRRTVPRLAPFMLLAALAGCSQSYLNGEIDDVYNPPMHYQRHPISVVKDTARIELVPHRGGLTRLERNEVARFAQSALAAASRSIGLSHPRNASATAAEVRSLLVSEGVPSRMIVATAYDGSGPVSLSFSRTVARTEPCGDWNENLARTGENESFPNFGCAHQQNIAAVVADPNDFVTPRAETPTDAPRKSQIFTDYRTPKDPSTPVVTEQDARVSEVGQ